MFKNPTQFTPRVRYRAPSIVVWPYSTGKFFISDRIDHIALCPKEKITNNHTMITSNLLIVSGKGKVEGGKGWHMPGKRLNCQAVRYRSYETTQGFSM